MSDAPRYQGWDDVPAGLRPENDLRFAGLEPRGAPVAVLVADGREVALFREADAVPRARGTTAASRGSVDPSRSSDRPAGTAGTRPTGIRRDLAFLPGVGSLPADNLRRAVVRSDADPSTGGGVALAWIRRLLLDDFVILDTETTGLGHRDEVIEVGVVGPDGAVRFGSLVRPRSGRVPAGATAVHGLTMETLAAAPTFAEVYDGLIAATAGRRVVAWNAPFDERLIRQSAAAWSLRARLSGFECAMQAYALTRGWRHGRAKLERAAVTMGLLGGRTQSHRSTDDARLVLEVLARAAAGR